MDISVNNPKNLSDFDAKLANFQRLALELVQPLVLEEHHLQSVITSIYGLIDPEKAEIMTVEQAKCLVPLFNQLAQCESRIISRLQPYNDRIVARYQMTMAGFGNALTRVYNRQSSGPLLTDL